MTTKQEIMKLAFHLAELAKTENVEFADKLDLAGRMLYDLAKEIDALRARLEQAEQQVPVAWVDVKCTHTGPYEFHGKELLPVGKHHLYTHPAPQPAALQPLTKTQVVEGFCSLQHSVQYVSVFEKGVRFAEAAHGIGAKP